MLDHRFCEGGRWKAGVGKGLMFEVLMFEDKKGRSQL